MRGKGDGKYEVRGSTNYMSFEGDIPGPCLATIVIAVRSGQRQTGWPLAGVFDAQPTEPTAISNGQVYLDSIGLGYGHGLRIPTSIAVNSMSPASGTTSAS